MTRVHDFAADLAKAGKSFKEISEMLNTVYGDKALKKTQIYVIIKAKKIYISEYATF
jgi:hypothetical protein